MESPLLVDKPSLLDPARFWQAAYDLYVRPGVAAICLELQDGPFAFNVNVMLVAVDFECHGVAIQERDFAHIDHAIHSWQSAVLAPLRVIRRHAKAKCDATYDTIKVAELEAERFEQTSILRTLGELQLFDVIDRPLTNLVAYARHKGAQDAPRVLDKLAQLQAASAC